MAANCTREVLMYTRAAASDYDEWEEKFKNPGWGSKDLIPLLKKVRLAEICGDEYTHLLLFKG